MTQGQVEMTFKGQYPELFQGCRYTMARMNGQILKGTDNCYLDAENAWFALASPLLGGIALPEVGEQAKELKLLVDHKLKVNQTKLLLRGEEGLAHRLHRQRYDAKRACSILLSTALRYGMEVAEDKQVPKKSPVDQTEPWTEVK